MQAISFDAHGVAVLFLTVLALCLFTRDNIPLESSSLAILIILVAGFALLVTLVLVVWLLRLGKDERLLAAALALIVGGAVGNLIDRVLLGHVVDFIQVYLPFIPLLYYTSRSLVSPNLSGWEDNIQNVHPTRFLSLSD